MAEARKLLGPTVTLGGNLNPVSEVLHSTPERIYRELQKIYEEVGNPYLVNAGCEVPVDTPLENLKALCRPIPMKA